MKKYTFLPCFLIATICIHAQNVGIGTTTPGFPLSFAPELGDKISLWSNSPNSYGFGIQGSLLQIHTDIAAADISFGYGSSVSFTERMRIKGNGLVGIGTTAPIALLDVNGSLRSASLSTSSLAITTGGNQTDFLIKSNPDGQVSFRKGYVGLGINYIIALLGEYPSQSAPQVQGPMIGEIRMFSGISAPYGWDFCHGQLLLVDDFPVLFSLIGTTYGGDGVNNFALPDLSSAVPVGEGSGWTLGEQSN